MILLNSILVATDFSKPSKVALAYGQNLARAFGAELHVLHVTDDMKNTPAAEFYPDTFENLQTQVDQSALLRLNQMLNGNAADVQKVIRASASPSRAIVDYAKAAHVDLIVTGTHGRTGASHLVMGSVAEKVARTAPCPVLVVRANEHEFVVPEPVRGDRRI